MLTHFPMTENEKKNLVEKVFKLEKMVAVEQEKRQAQDEKINKNAGAIVDNYKEFQSSDEENKRFRNRQIGIVIAVNAVYLPIVMTLIMKYVVG